MATLVDPVAGAVMAPAWTRVRTVTKELGDTFTVALEAPGGSFPFRPGQFTMLSRFGIGEIPISISGDPADPSSLVQTIRSVGAASLALTDVAPGSLVGVRGPFGVPWPLEAAAGRDVVVVAGGIGLAPLRPAIHSVLANRDRYRRVCVLYGARTPADLLFAGDLHTWRGRFDVDVMITVDNADHSWKGSVGVVTDVIRRAAFDPASTTALVCGPGVMMRFAAGALLADGVAPHDVFVSLERNMQCGVGLCGHCQLGPLLVCRDGPVVRWSEIAPFFSIREV